MTETLCKLYLELANVLPKDCISSREIKLGKIADTYGLALMMIANGAQGPEDIARKAIARAQELDPQHSDPVQAVPRP